MQTKQQSEATVESRRKTRAERRAQAATSAFALLSANGLLRLPTVLAVYPVGTSTWWAGIASGRFPAGVKLSARCTAWRAEDIRDLIERAACGEAGM